MDRPSIVGMAWYRREDFPRLRQVMEDADRLPDTFELWALSAEQVEREVARSGVIVVRAMLDPDAFVAWCAERGVKRDGAARSRFASEFAAGPALIVPRSAEP